MMKTFEELNKELINRGLVYDSPDIPDMYEQCAKLEGIYEWGFTIITYCNVVDPVITFYDWEYQSILSLDHDDHTHYTLQNGRLYVEEHMYFSDVVNKYSVNLKVGAPVHDKDVVAIGYMPNLGYSDDKRFYILKDGRTFFKEDGSSLCKVDTTLTEFITQGYELIDIEHYGNNINILNDMLCKATA